MELRGQCKISKMNFSKSEVSKISPTWKIQSIVDKEVTLTLLNSSTFFIVRDRSKAICELLTDTNKL
jgi:hypothetical protein